MRTPVINLGETGLASPGTLAFRLYLEGGDAPVTLDSSGVAAHEVDDASGDYWFDGFDLPVGQSASLLIAKAADPIPALYTVPLKAQAPPPVVVYRRQILVDPLGPITQHDTLGVIAIVVRSGLAEDPVIAGYSATFSLRADDAAGELVIDHEPASLADSVFDTLTGSWGVTVAYQLTSPATASRGRYRGTFKLTTDGGAIKTLTAPPLEIRILPDIGG